MERAHPPGRRRLFEARKEDTLIARELGKYQIGIAALSETRLAREGSIAEPKGGYTFFWRGKAKTPVTPESPERCGGQSLGLTRTAKSCRPAIDTATLKELERSCMFAKDLNNRLTAQGPLSGPPPQQWEQFKTLATESAKLTIGPEKEVHQDWFDENGERIKELLGNKKKAFIENDISSTSKRDHFKHLQRQTQTALRRMQDEWSEKNANEIKTCAATKNSKMFFSATKEVFSPTKPSTTPLLSADDSTLLIEKSSINARCREHFSILLNRPSIVIDKIPHKPLIITLDLPPTIDEASKAIRRTRSGKSPWDGRDSCRDLQVSRSSDPRSTSFTPHQHLGRRGCAQRTQECHIHLPVQEQGQ